MRKEEESLRKLSVNFIKTDSFFLQLTLAISLVGLIFAFSSSTDVSYKLSNTFWSLGLKQLVAFMFGLILLFIAWKTHYKNWYKLTWFFAILALLLMLLTIFSSIGKNIGGAKRWIDLGFFQFQPAELAKFAVLLLFTRHITKYRWKNKRGLIYLIAAFLLILLVLKQPDLGSSGILVLLFLSLILLFEWPIWLVLSIVLTLFYLCILKVTHTEYQMDRIKYWINPYLEPLGRGYNIIQSKYAIGLGGILGQGFGNSIQKNGALPVPHSDFVFAIIGEETGFIGLTIILTLFLSWFIRGLYLTNKVKDRYGKILATGIILIILIQTLINITVAVGLLPITGVTLPFFSCGGTSLILTLLMCGILFNIFGSIEEKTT